MLTDITCMEDYFQLVKAGLTLTGSISYEMTVECSLNPRSWNGCISVYDEWPGALLTFYAYYQTRRTLWVRTLLMSIIAIVLNSQVFVLDTLYGLS